MEILANLPESLVEVAEEVGIVNTLALAAIYGGQQLYIPLHFPEDHLIVQVFGPEVAQRLAFRFGGGALDLAKGQALQREARDSQICRERPTSKVVELARRYHLSERAVWAILQRRRVRVRGQDCEGQLELPM